MAWLQDTPMTNGLQANINQSHGSRVDQGLTSLEPVDPIPVPSDEVPEFLNDDDIIREEVPYMYSRVRRNGSIVLITLLIISVIFIGVRDFSHVYNTTMVVIDDFSVSEINDEGILVDIRGISFELETLGIFGWMSIFNETDVHFMENLTISNDVDNEIVFDVDMQSKNVSFELSSRNTLDFDFQDLFIRVNGSELSKCLNALGADLGNLKLSTKVKAHGLVFSIEKRVSLISRKISGLLQNIIDLFLNNLLIYDLSLQPYILERGFPGSCRIDILKFVPVSQIPKFDVELGFKIGGTFQSFISIQHENGEMFFMIYNVDQSIIDEGLIDDIFWRLINDDSKEAFFKVVVCGNNHEATGWFADTIENINMEIGLHLHNFTKHLFWSGDDDTGISIFKRFEMPVLKVYNDNEGRIGVSTEIFTIFDRIVDFFPFESTVNGIFTINGIDLEMMDLFVTAFDNGLVDLKLKRVMFDVLNVDDSVSFVQDLINFNDIMNPEENVIMDFDLTGYIFSSFFRGNINLNGAINFEEDSLIRRLESTFNSIVSMNKQVKLIGIEFLESEYDFLKIKANTEVALPFSLKEFANELANTAVRVEFEEREIVILRVAAFESDDGMANVNIEVELDTSKIENKHKIEEFIGEFVSGVSNNVTITGKEGKSLIGSNGNINEFFSSILIPCNISSNNINTGNSQENYFIKDTVMHIISKEVEMTLFNPMDNKNIIVEILEAEAQCEGYIIGFLRDRVIWNIASGIWNSPKEKVEYANTGSAGWRIIERAMKGDGLLQNISVRAVIRITIEGEVFNGLNVLYQSVGNTKAKVRW